MGEACVEGHECQTLHCEWAAACGSTCQELPQEVAQDQPGDPCEVHFSEGGGTLDCDGPNLVCDPETLMCVPKPGVEEPCLTLTVEEFSTSIVYCARGLVCHDDVCVEPLFHGETCSPADDRCAEAEGLACGTAETCEVSVPAHLEGDCGSYLFLPCGYLDKCVGENEPFPDAFGTCVPREPSEPAPPDWDFCHDD